MEQRLQKFINAILETRRVWLLEAKEGFFAMLEDNDGNSYIPLWATEEEAQRNAAGDWDGYTTTYMGFSELEHWLKELADDDIDIAVAPEREGEIVAIPARKFKTWLKPYDDHSYKEEDEDDDEEDHDIKTQYGPDNKSFDYGEGWAQPWQ